MEVMEVVEGAMMVVEGVIFKSAERERRSEE